MRVVVMAEKPSLAALILEQVILNNPYPDAEWYGVALPPYCVLGMSFRFPRGIPYSSYPLIAEPDYHEIQRSHPHKVTHREDGSSVAGPFCWKKIIDDKVVNHGPSTVPRFPIDDLLETADRIIMCFDTDATAQQGSLKIHDFLRSMNQDAEITFHPVSDYRYQAIREVLKSPVSIDTVEAMSNPSVIKRFFDFNFLNNRNVILRRTFDRIGNPKQAVLPSKFGVQLLYWLSDNPGGVASTQRLSDVKRHWPGTGRYANNAPGEEWCRYLFCNIAAEEAIIEDLKAGNLVVRDRQELRITDMGRAFLAALHPDCRDLDLPYRIREWQALEVDVAKVKIAKYLKTWFGKQKRFLKKYPNVG